MTTPTITTTLASIDPEAAKNAYEAALPRARALQPADYLINRTDVQQAAIIALAVAQHIATPDVRARFDLLPASVFDHTHLDDLPQLALATYHGFAELTSARVGSTEAKLPADLVEGADQVKKRMLDLCEYAFGSDPVLSLEVASIRAGTGYKDKALDLTRLAELYDEHELVLSQDVFKYRATDKDDARRYAQAIVLALGQTQNAGVLAQRDIVTALWTLLSTCYDEVRAAGRFLYRHENGDAMFPSLHQRTRRTRTDDSGSEPADPTGDSPESSEPSNTAANI